MKDTEFNLADSLPNRQANSNNENRFALHVCTSCRPSGFPREPKENRPGFCLYNQLDKLLEEQNLKDKIDILPADCLSLCSRPCGIALSSPGSWSYLFGDQDADRTAEDIVECVKTYIQTNDGDMPRGQRPLTLRSSILGRIPPNIQNIKIVGDNL